MPVQLSALPAQERALGLALTIALHAVAGFVLLSLAQPLVQQMRAPPIYVSMITAPEKEEAPPAPPKPLPLAPKPQPRQQPQAKPQALAPKLIQTSEDAPALALAPVAPPAPEHAPAAEPSPKAAPAQPQAAAPETILAPRHDADYLHNPKPEYPRASRSLGEEGKVWLRVQVSPEGRPLQVLIDTSSGFQRLDHAARNTVASSWHFEPARMGDKPVIGWVRFAIHFELNH